MLARVLTLKARLFPRGVFDVVLQVALFFAMYYAYRLLRGAIDDPEGAAVAFQNARNLIHLERSLGLFIEPGMQAWAESSGFLVDAASVIYVNAQTSVTVGALMYLYLRHNSHFYFVRNMFFVAFLCAVAGYVLYPTAPPRFFPEWGFFDAVAELSGIDSTDPSLVNKLYNPYAAVPSMHICFSLMIGVPLARLVRLRALKIFWGSYPLLVCFVIIVTGNHFLADAVLGAVAAGIAAAAAVGMARLRPAQWGWGAAPEPVPVPAAAPVTA